MKIDDAPFTEEEKKQIKAMGITSASWGHPAVVLDNPVQFFQDFLNRRRGEEKIERVIAQWLLKKYLEHDHLSQTTAINEILNQFGRQYLYTNKNNNLAIKKSILEEFRKLTPVNVVWSRGAQTWRTRKPTDPIYTRMVP